MDVLVLKWLLVIPVIAVVNLLCISKYDIVLLRRVGLIWSVIEFVLSLFLWLKLDDTFVSFQCVERFDWLNSLGISYAIGIDGLSLFMINLSALLIVICILCSWSTIKYRLKELIMLLHVVLFCLVNVFVVLDLILFYIFFESVLIPMFLIVGVWGSRDRKIHAAYQFFLYTLAGSLLMLLSIVLIHFSIGSTDINALYMFECDDYRQRVIWLAFFLSFSVKIPMFPFHIWLPEAHVEAPTAGSVLLAGILLKLGGYGFLRFSLPVLGLANVYFTPLVYLISGIGVVYCSLTTIRQIDMKKIIAYSSVAHMNYVTAGIFSGTLQGLEGGIFLMLSHGLVSSSLFLCIGMLYDRYKSRLLSYYGGLVQVMPLYSILFLLFILANISFPGTSSFVGEILVLAGVVKVNTFITLILFIGVILGAVYSMYLYNRVIFGTLKLKMYSDLNKREYVMLLHMFVLVLIFGLYPNLVLDRLHGCTSYIVCMF